MFQPLVKWFKLFCFENFGGFEEVSAGTQTPIATMLKKSKRCTMLGSAYLTFVTFFIFLTAMRMNDNKTIMFVMLTTFVSEATFIGMVHPIETLITVGFLPAIAASFFFSDVTRHMREEHDQANAVRRLDAQERVIDPNGPFEVSPEWRRIEEAFSGVTAAGPANGDSEGRPKVLSGARSRVRGVVVDGQMLSRNMTAWDLSIELHKHGVSSVCQLKNRTVVSKEWLANSIKLNDQQVEAFWRAVHEPLIEDKEERGHLQAILSRLFGKKARAGTSSSQPELAGRKLRLGSIFQAPESPSGRKGRKMSIFPVLAGTKARGHGSSNSSDEDDSSEDEQKSEEPEDKVLSAARKFKGLRIKAKAGNNNAMGASASPTPRGVTDLRSPTHQKDEEGRAPEHVAAGDVEEQAVHAAIPPREESSPDVAATDARNGVLRVEVDEIEPTIEEWLDSINPGDGEAYASLFHTHGVGTVAKLMHLDMDQLRDIVGQIDDKYARRDIRSAVKDYMKERLPETREEAQTMAGAVDEPIPYDTAPADDHEASHHDMAPAPAESSLSVAIEEVPGTEQVGAGTPEEVASPALPPAESSEVEEGPSIEVWLDALEAGYGESYGSLFRVHGASSVEQLHHVDFDELRGIVGKLSDKAARKRLRAALRKELESSLPASAEEAGAHEQVIGADDALVAPSVEGTTVKVESPDASIEEWLDSIESGLGEVYGRWFHAAGAESVAQVAEMDIEHLGSILGALSDKTTRRKVRGAVRDLVALVADTEAPAIEAAPAAEEYAKADGTSAAQLSIEDWLDAVQEGYAGMFGHIFRSAGVNAPDQLHGLEKEQLGDILGQFTDKQTRRAIRSALREHLSWGEE